jgi:hypothetical protein
MAQGVKDFEPYGLKAAKINDHFAEAELGAGREEI